MQRECLAVIPARGGSKGIPLKNLRRIGGVPLVERAVLAVSASRHVTRVVVSTDDDRIADVALRAGAEVVRRPPDISGDSASSESAVLHALDVVDGPEPEIVLLVQCTSPFIAAADVDGTIEALDSEAADCALTVAANHRFLWRRDDDGQALGVNHDPARRLPRQELAPEYVETGAVYAMRVDGFRRFGHRFFGRIAMHQVDSWRAIEIDDPYELEIAATLERLCGPQGAHALPAHVAGVVFDFDGVMTDDRVWTTQDGVEMVVASRSDGLGIERLRRAGMPMLILSKERNPVVAARAAKVQVECLQGVDDKLSALVAWAGDNGWSLEEVVYVGNDVNDRDCLEAVGCGVIPADAHPDVRSSAKLVLRNPGGFGAVRELADLILQSQGAT